MPFRRHCPTVKTKPRGATGNERAPACDRASCTPSIPGNEVMLRRNKLPGYLPKFPPPGVRSIKRKL